MWARGGEVGLPGAEADDGLAGRLEGLGLGVDGQGGRRRRLAEYACRDPCHCCHSWHSDQRPSAGYPIPADLPARRRPLRLRPVQGPARGGGRRWPRPATTFLGTSHRQAAVKSVVGRLRAGLAELFGLPDGYEVVLGNGGTTAFWDVATFGLIERRSQHLVFGEFSSKFAAAAAAAPHLGDPEVIESATGTHPEAVARPGRRRLRPHPQRDLDRRDDGHRGGPAAPDATLWSLVDATSAAGGLRVDPAAGRRLLLRPPEVLRLRRRPVAGPAVARRGRAHRRASTASGRWVPASLDLAIALENSRQDQTYNTPALATLWLLAAAGRVDARPRRPRVVRRPVRPLGRHPLRVGRVVALRHARSWPSRTSAPTWSAPSTSTTVCPPRPWSSVLRANGIVDTESYRKLGRNQLRIGMFPAIEPADVEALTALHRLRGRTAGLRRSSRRRRASRGLGPVPHTGAGCRGTSSPARPGRRQVRRPNPRWPTSPTATPANANAHTVASKARTAWRAPDRAAQLARTLTSTSSGGPS